MSLDIVSSFYWISFQAVKQNRYLSLCHSALALSQAVAKERRRLRMESKANKNSHVLMFGLSVNLILTLGSLGFTCYSLHRLDSRLTTLERNSPLKKLSVPDFQSFFCCANICTYSSKWITRERNWSRPKSC